MYILWIVMFLRFINTRLASKHISYFSLSNLYSSTILATSLFFLREKFTLPHFLKNKQNSNPHPVCKEREIQLWLIKTTCFTYLLLKIDPVKIEALNLKFWECFIYWTSKNVSMIKPKKYVGGSSTLTRVFFGILVHVPGRGL